MIQFYRKKLAKVLEDHYTDESSSKCKDYEAAPVKTLASSTGPKSEDAIQSETLLPANPPIKNINAFFNDLKDSNTGKVIENALQIFCNGNTLLANNIKSALDIRFMDYVDYVTGVSIGSIIAAGLTICDTEAKYKYTTQDLMTALEPDVFLKETPLV